MRQSLSPAWREALAAPPNFLVSFKLNREQDAVLAHQRARQFAQLLGYEAPDQVRIATAVSEIAREGLQFGESATIDLGLSEPIGFLLVQLTCPQPRMSGPAAGRDLKSAEGVHIARRILGDFRLEMQGEVQVCLFGRPLPLNANVYNPAFVQKLTETVGQLQPRNSFQEFQAQNQELLDSLNELRRHQLELAKLNQELEETNRGVVALYSELEEKAESLRRAQEQRSRFYSSISHEFRTPVTSIVSLSQILLNRLDGELTGEQERQVSLIRQCGQNMLEWVNDLLDLARADAGRMELRPTTFCLKDLLAGLRGVMRPLAENAAVELIIDWTPEAGEQELYTDEVKLSQILRNFVSNALKFTERGSVRVCPIKSGVPAGMVEIVVQDTGVGIAQEDLTRIFDEFVQVDNPLQRNRKGTGLGLPLSKRLAELLGGSIRVESQPGVGSTFYLQVPCRVGTAAEQRSAGDASISEPAQIASGDAAPQILIVDDDGSCRYLLQQVFSELGLTAVEAADGRQGLRLAAELRPQAIFLDLVMPELNGVEVLKELKTTEITREIPVIIYSSQPGDIQKYPQWLPFVSSVLEKPRDSAGPPRDEIELALQAAGIATAAPPKEMS